MLQSSFTENSHENKLELSTEHIPVVATLIITKNGNKQG